MKPEEQVRADFEAWWRVTWDVETKFHVDSAGRYLEEDQRNAFYGYRAAYAQARREALEDQLDAERYRVLRMFKLGSGSWPFKNVPAPAGLIGWSCMNDDHDVITQTALDRLLDDMLGRLAGPTGVRSDYKEWRAAETKRRINAALKGETTYD